LLENKINFFVLGRISTNMSCSIEFQNKDFDADSGDHQGRISPHYSPSSLAQRGYGVRDARR
jgi:hypothetical protein